MGKHGTSVERICDDRLKPQGGWDDLAVERALSHPKKSKWSSRRRALFLSVAAAGSLAGLDIRLAQGAAVTYTWTGASSSTFASSGNWNSSTGLYPGNTNSDIALFNTAPPANQPNLTASDTIAEVMFAGTGATGYAISATNAAVLNLTSAAGGTTSAIDFNGVSNYSETISAPVNFAAASGFSQFLEGSSSTDTLTFSGGITASAGTLAIGGGSYVFGSNPSLSSIVKLEVGNLVVNSSTSLGTGQFQLGNSSANGFLVASVSLTGANAITNSILWNSAYAPILNVPGASSSLELSGNEDLGGAARTVSTANAGGVILSGTISDDAGGGLTISTSSTSQVTLSGTNTYSGATTVISNTGDLAVPSIGNSSGSTASPLGESTTINLGSGTLGGSLYYTGTGETTNKIINLNGSTGGGTIDTGSNIAGGGSLDFSASITAAAGAKTLTLQGAGNGVFAGNIVNSSGTVALTKSGLGTWTLPGANTYTGNTSISAGVLNVTGSLSASSAVSVSTAGTLSGNGSMGAITANGTVDPSGTAGIVTTGTINATSLTLSSGTLTINIDPTGNANSEVMVSTTPSFSGGSNLYLNLISAGNPIGKTYVIVENTGSGAAASNLFAANHLFGGGGYTYTVSYTYNADAGSVANDVAVTFTPELSTLGLLAIGSVSLLRRRRRWSVRPGALRQS